MLRSPHRRPRSLPLGLRIGGLGGGVLNSGGNGVVIWVGVGHGGAVRVSGRSDPGFDCKKIGFC